MPYYKEEFANRALSSRYWLNGALVNDGSVVMDSAELTGFRSRPHSEAIASSEVSSLSADPYASFLESTSRIKYHARLKERGLEAMGDPDRGHTFYLKKHSIAGPAHNLTARGSGNTRVYENCLLVPGYPTTSLNTVHSGSAFSPAPYAETGLDTFAQQAYARTAPTSVVFDAALFLGELREGLPRLIPSVLKDGINVFKNLGKDYLNFEFGWKPFISDLQNAAQALLGATDMLAQQGKRVHRSYSLPLTQSAGVLSGTDTLELYVGGIKGFAASYNAGNFGVLTTSALRNVSFDLTKTRNSRRWFEGEFSSFYPLGFDPNDFLQRLSLLMNPKITPSTLWELAPWSWLVDWNLRIGDTIRANELNANDLLVMHYGYAMEKTVYATASSWRVLSNISATSTMSGVPSRGYIQSTTTYKRRLRANPYGFRVGGAGALTGSQTAILGALGLTKLK